MPVEPAVNAVGRPRTRTREGRRTVGLGPEDADPEHRPPGPVFVRWMIPPTAAGVPEVRHRLRDLLRGWGVSGEIEDTLLLVATELTSNAVRHAATRTDTVRITAALDDDDVRLEISDGHPFHPKALMETGPESEDGRGLLIVKLLVAELDGLIDVFASGTGKTIRVTVNRAARG